MKKCKGGCQMKSGGKACSKCGCDREDEEYEKGEKEMRSGGMACMKCGGKMHKSGGTVSSCMKCGGGKYTFGGKVGWSKKKVTSEYAFGGMIKRADGSYSQRGLWDNIRANAGIGKKPTKQMLEQEKKIKQKMAVGGMVDTGCPDGMVRDFFTGKCVPAATTQDSTDVYNSAINLQNKMSSLGYLPDHNNWTIQEKSYSTSEVSPQELLAEKTYLNPNKKLTDVPLLGTAAYKYKNDKNKRLVEDVGDFYVNKKIDENKYEVSELSSTAGYNTDLPYQLFDRRIAPTSFKGYGYDRSNPLNPKDAIGDSALMLSYDPVKVKIYSERTPEEHIEYQQKYGNYGGAAEPYVPPVSASEEREKELEIIRQDLIKTAELELANRPQEPDYYNMKTIGFSPEDAKIIYELQGLGPREGSRGSSAYEKDLALKLKMYKSGKEFAPIMQQVGGYNNIPRHDFSPTLEDVRRFREEPGYRQQWDKDILMQHYGYKPIDFQATNKRKQYSFGGAIKSFKVGGMANNCPPGWKWDESIQDCVPAWDYRSGYKKEDFRPYLLNQITKNNKENPTKYYDEGDPEGIKAYQSYQDSSALYRQSIKDIQNFDNKTLPNYKPFTKGIGGMNEAFDKMFYPSGITPVGKFVSSNTTQCSKDGVCIDVYPKPVQPIGFKKKMEPQMDPKQTLGYKMSEITQTPNTYENRKSLAREYGFEKLTGRPYTGTGKDNEDLYEQILKEQERIKKLTEEEKENERKIERELKEGASPNFPEMTRPGGGSERSLTPTATEETFIKEVPEIINMPTIKPGIIPIKPVTLPMMNPTPWDPYFVNQSEYQNTIAENTGMGMSNKNKKKFSFGGAINKLKKYQYGGEIDNTAMTTDAEMPLSKGAYNVPEPTYDASVVSNVSPMQITDNVTQGTEQLGYKEIVKSFQKKNIDKSLPNWGYAKQEQIKLNELIRNDISAGNAKMDILVEDDIIGDNTLKAMRAYEASGQYTRPEGFKDKWLAEYKKQWEESKKPKQETSEVKSPEPKQPTNKQNSFYFPSMSDIVTGVQSGFNYGSNAINSFIQGAGEFIQGAGEFIDKYQKAFSEKSSDKPKVNKNNSLDDLYSYFNNYKEKPKNMPAGWSVMRPKEQSSGWPRTALLQEGGIEISASDLKRKDFDTYFPIPGVTKSKKGVRATGRDKNESFFDAVEKTQNQRKDGTSLNTSLQLIDKLLSSSNKAIVIPQGKDKYGRDLNDIYLQDPNYPDRFHALDSLGVLEGEAIFGHTLFPLPENLTPRQQKINKQAEEKGGYKYKQSPSDYRRFEKLGIKTKPTSSVFENQELETEILNRQKYDNQQYGKFMSKGKNVANRTDIKRNADSEAFFADYAEPNSVIIDIGSALGNPNPSLAGVSVNELAKNQSIKKKGIKVIATDIPSEVETFRMHQRNKQALDIDYAEVPMSYNTPITKILKDKNLNDRENIYLRSANSIDLLMTPEETKQHLEHIAKTLKDKNVIYVFNNVILTKPKGLTMFGKAGNINNAAFDHNTPSWKSNTNRKPYTLNS